jgi:hypothetical protein
MARPGVEVTLVPTPPSRGVPTETGPLFAIGLTTTPQAKAVKCQNMDQVKAACGATPPAGGVDFYNALDVYFREGGSVLYVGTMAAAGDVATALAKFNDQLGPGQVAGPGITVAADQKLIIAHALANNRVALIDFAKSATDTALTTAAVALNTEAGAKFAAGFGNWIQFTGSGGTTITVPPSAVAAALMARNDRRNSPNVPAAGQNGEVTGATGLDTEFSGTIGETLNTAGVNVFRNVYGSYELYGYRSLALKASDPNWWMFNHARLYIGIKALCQRIGEAIVVAEIDGQRRRLAQFEGDLVAELLPLYTAGSLYGDTPEEAFLVDAVSLQANPDAQLADGIVRANVAVRMSPFAELVLIPITKVAITQQIAA